MYLVFFCRKSFGTLQQAAMTVKGSVSQVHARKSLRGARNHANRFGHYNGYRAYVQAESECETRRIFLDGREYGEVWIHGEWRLYQLPR